MFPPTARGVQLQYRYVTEAQTGSQVDNPLFDLLSAVAAEGSIQGAARALGFSYRHLWGSLKQWEDTVGQALVVWQRGQPARLTPYAERLLWAERQARERMVPHIEALRRELQRVMEEALDGSRQVLRIDASHDLMLPVLQGLADDQGLHLELRFAGSLDALRSLAEGRCVVAGFHAPPLRRSEHYARALKALLKPGRHKLISTMRRTQGLLLAPGNPMGIRSLGEVAARGLRFVAREPGSGTGLLAEHLAAHQGFALSTLNTTVQETSHLACAAAVASGTADAALGIEAAAVRYGLGFVPLVEEDYFLVCLADALDQPAVRLLCKLLQAPDWRRALQDLDGYACPPAAGEVLSLTRALPWWTFRSPKTDGCGPLAENDPGPADP
jgi:putative molybdopterin biosynthesis protein